MNAKQSRFVQFLLDGATVKDAAKAAGVPLRTAASWRARQDVQAALEAGQREIQQAVCHRIVSSALTAHDTLLELATSSEKEAVRYQAAAKLLDLAHTWAAIADIQRRLAALENPEEYHVIDQR